MDEINERIRYLEQRFTELVNLCEKDTTPKVSEDVKNVSQDIFTALNRLLDNIMFRFYTEKIKPSLSTEKTEKYDKQVSYPVCTDKQSLVQHLSHFGASSLENSHPGLFNVIESSQPYKGSDWIGCIRKYSNIGHRKLVSQSKKRNINLILGDTIKIGIGGKVTISNVLINGIPIQHLQVDRGTISGDLDPRLRPRVEIKTTYLLENDDVDLISLCKESIEKIRTIASNFEQYL
jgi:hypothetical protein